MDCLLIEAARFLAPRKAAVEDRTGSHAIATRTKGIGGQGISSPRPGSDGIDNSARVGWRVGPALGGVCLIALGSRKVRLLNLTADKVPSPHPARPCSGAEFRVVFAGFAAPFGQPGMEAAPGCKAGGVATSRPFYGLATGEFEGAFSAGFRTDGVDGEAAEATFGLSRW